MRRNRPRRRSGFTLMEVLLVLVILVILGSMAAFFVKGPRKQANINAAKSQIGLFKKALEYYEFSVGALPSTTEGLQALRTPPNGLEPMLDKEIPFDPWGNPYQYEVDGEAFSVWSMGPDGESGSADDITSE